MAHTVLVAGKGTESMRSFIKGLQNYSCSLIIAVDGQDALRLLKKGKTPMAIALASSLETVTAQEVCQWLSSNPRYSKIPVVILEETPVDRAEYAKFFIEAFLAQPYSAYEVHKMLSGLAATSRVEPGGGMKMKNQLIGVIVAFVLFLAFFSYFILMPMIEGHRMEQEKKIGATRSSRTR